MLFKVIQLNKAQAERSLITVSQLTKEQSKE